MGKIGESFKREVGKNTGKFVSNLMFGDKHSTPYRRVDAERHARAQEAALERQKDIDMNLLDGAVLDNVDEVLQTPIPQSEKELFDLMSIWGAQLANSSWDFDTKEGNIRAQYPDAVLEKFKQSMLIARTIAPSNPMMSYYEEILAKATKRRKRAKTKELRIALIGIGLFALCVLIIAIFGD